MQSDERSRLIQQQDVEFQQSLMIDRVKVISRELAEYYKKHKREQLERLRSYFYDSNPVIEEDLPEYITVVIRLPDGHIVSHKFHEDRTIGNVRDFVDIQYLNGHDIPINYDIIQNYPLISYGNDTKLYQVLGNQPGSRRRINLFVREKMLS
jgi:hypothetical protein